MGEKKTKKTAADYPELVKQWSNKNEFPPDKYSDGSHKKVWWKCSNPDHPPWQTELRKRTKRGYNCPYCSKKRVSKEHNLAVYNPDLLKDWDYQKNSRLGMNPDLIAPSSNKKAWWICEKGHSWFARINSRNRRDGKIGCKCPYCSGRKASPETSLAAVNPDLAEEWHPEKNLDTPWEIKPQSAEKRWWICAQGHEWLAVVSSRTNGRGCPMCHAQISRLELRIFCEFEVLFGTFNVLSKHRIDGYEADVFIVDQKIAIEINGFYYHRNRSEQDTLKNEIFLKLGIPLIHLREFGLEKIGEHEVIYEDNQDEFQIVKNLVTKLLSLQMISPHFEMILKQYLKRDEFINKDGYKKRLKEIFKPMPGKSLGEVIPESVEIWDFEKNHPLTPFDVFSRSKAEAWFKCPIGKHPSEKMSIQNVVNVIGSKFKGCAYCAGKKVVEEESLVKTHPDIAARWDQDKNDFSPFDVTAQSGKKAWFICPRCERSYQVTIGSLVKTKGFGCSKCHNQYGQYHANDRQTSDEILKALDEKSDSDENSVKAERRLS